MSNIIINRHGNNIVWDQLPHNDIIVSYEGGESELSLSKRFNVSRRVIRKVLIVNNVDVRGIKAANSLMMSKRTPEENQLATKAAHDFLRGRKANPERIKKMAKWRQENKWHMSESEKLLYGWLSERGENFIPQMACGSYNIDLAIHPIAVEILGGGWHRGKAIHSKREEYIFNAGWSMIFIWVNARRSPIIPLVADYIISKLDILRNDPAPSGKYWVIRGDGKELSTGCFDPDNFTFVVPGYEGGRETY
jgi:very-short-patch-repair endonuclease